MDSTIFQGVFLLKMKRGNVPQLHLPSSNNNPVQIVYDKNDTENLLGSPLVGNIQINCQT